MRSFVGISAKGRRCDCFTGCNIISLVGARGLPSNCGRGPSLTHNGWMVGAITDLGRSRHDLLLENALLRQQLIVVERQVKRPTLTYPDRALFVVLPSGLQT